MLLCTNMCIFFSFSQSGLVHLRDVLFVGNPIYDDMPREQARIEVRTITMTLNSYLIESV